MRKRRVLILLALIIFPSLILIFNTTTTTNFTNLNKNSDFHENDYQHNHIPLTSDDNYEDNDDFDHAKVISKGWYYLMSEDEDWFKVWLEEGEEFGIEIRFTHAFGDLDLELRNSTNFAIAWSMSSNDYEHIEWVAGYTGYYYIWILNYAVPNSYELDIFNSGDKYEMNNDFWSASEIYKGYNRHLNKRTDDWYKVYCDFGELLTVDIYFDHIYGDLDLEIYEASNPFTAYIRSDTLTDDESLTFTANYFGFYYIRVYGKTSSAQNDYSMKIGGSEITIFQEDFEGAISGKWTGIGGNNYMHVTSRDYSPFGPPGVHSLWCGNESTGNYDKKQGSFSILYKESAIINDLDLTDFAYVELSFDYNSSVGFGEQTNLSIRALGSQYYLNPKYTDGTFELGGNSQSSTGWQNLTFDLSFFCGFESIDIIFSFETLDYSDNWLYEGIKIDNIVVKGFKDDSNLGNSLGIHVGDELYYYFPYVDNYQWNDVFGKDIFAYQYGNIKIEIYSIMDYGPYWDITTRFWDPWDDFEELQGTDEIKYRVYKNPLNIESGGGLFIPSGDVMRYLDRADNYDGENWDSSYDIHHWYEPKWNEYGIEYRYDDFRVHLNYASNGILNGMTIDKIIDPYNSQRIFEMWQGEPYEDNDEDDEEDEERRAVPGYDLLIIISLISVVSIIMAKKIKKSKK